MKKTILLLSTCLAAQSAGAVDLESINLKNMNVESRSIVVPAARQGNYSLNPDSYDPLLTRPPGSGEK